VAGVTTRKQIGRAIELLRQVDAPIVGTVLNGVSAEGAYGYDYRYARYEQAEPAGANGNGLKGAVADAKKGKGSDQPAKRR
jgi:Mrp family chromosome partitioning ATPase